MDLLYFSIPAFVIGLLFGSFMNVCLSRWPAGESIIKPGSHCRSCGHMLSWWENIPILSWIFLCGRCRKCKAWIGWRYPAVELLMGLLLVAAIYTAQPAAFKIPLLSTPAIYFPILATAVFCWLIVALALLDAKNFWLPDLLTIPGIAFGFFFRCFAAYISPLTPRSNLIHHIFIVLLEIAAAGGVVLLIRWIYFLIRKQEGMGLGDAKLMAMLGAWLGWKLTLLSFVLGIFLAAAFAFVLLMRGNPDERAEAGKPEWARKHLPFGTFLCIGGLVSYFFGGKLIALYLGLVGL